MNTKLNIAIIFCLSLLLISIPACKNKNDISASTNNTQLIANTETKDINQNPNDPTPKTSTSESRLNNITANKQQAKLPKLIDLGADKCIPCKMMKPILDGLKTDYAGKLDVEVIDVWKNPGEGNKYNINLIPTQIFYDPDGNEFLRHEGFMSKDDILDAFKKKGISLE